MFHAVTVSGCVCWQFCMASQGALAALFLELCIALNGLKEKKYFLHVDVREQQLLGQPIFL